MANPKLTDIENMLDDIIEKTSNPDSFDIEDEESDDEDIDISELDLLEEMLSDITELESDLDFADPDFWETFSIDDLKDFIALSEKIDIEDYEHIERHTVNWYTNDDASTRYGRPITRISKEDIPKVHYKKSSIVHNDDGIIPTTIENEDYHDLMVEAFLSYLWWTEQWEVHRVKKCGKRIRDSLRILRRLIRLRIKQYRGEFLSFYGNEEQNKGK